MRRGVIAPGDGDAIRLFHCPFQRLEEVAGIAPGAVRRFDFAVPPDTPPGALYRLVLTLAGPDATLDATTPVEVLPPA